MSPVGEFLVDAGTDTGTKSKQSKSTTSSAKDAPTPPRASSPSAPGPRKRRVSTRANMWANESVFGNLAVHPKFENSTYLVIVLNAMWLCVDVQFNHDNMKDEDTGKLPLEPYSVIVENLFCSYFTFEVIVRFIAFKKKMNCLWDPWFVFDTFLVTLMIVETWLIQIIVELAGGGGGSDVLANFSVLRLLRLLRLARMARLMRALPELLTLVRGIVKAAKAVIWIFVLLGALLYMFGIMFTATFEKAPRIRKDGYLEALSDVAVTHLSPELAALSALVQTPAPDPFACEEEADEGGGDLFATLGDSIINLFTRGVLGDNLQETCDAIKAQSDYMQAVFFVFFGLTFALLLNMLIGVLCEVVSGSAKEEEALMSVNYLKSTIKDAFHELDVNKDGVVCREEFMTLKASPAVRNSMVEIGMAEDRIDIQLQQMQDVIFQHEMQRGNTPEKNASRRTSQARDGRIGVTVDQLMETLVEVRPGMDASALDFEILKVNWTQNLKRFGKQLETIENHVATALGPDYVDDGIDNEDDNEKTSRSELPDSKKSSQNFDIMSEDLPSYMQHSSSLRQAASVKDLQDIPTEVLFREMQRRTAPQPGVIHGPGCRPAYRG